MLQELDVIYRNRTPNYIPVLFCFVDLESVVGRTMHE